MSSKATHHEKRYDLSLTLIYQALQKPHSSTSVTCRNDLHTASVKQLDYTLRKLKSYSKQSQWPPHRLVRCLDYIFTHGIKSSPDLHDLIQLSSLKACVRWILTAADEESTLGSVKFICNLLETFASKLPDSPSTIGILSDIKAHNGPKLLLDWSKHANHAVRTYSVRALSAKLQFFAKYLITLDAYTILSQSLLEIPSLLHMLILKPPVSDASQKRTELEQCIMTCRLLESIFKYEQLDQASQERISFADSQLFVKLVSVWHQVCHHEYTTLMNNLSPLKIKNGQLLIYSLTTIIQKCSSISQKAASCVAAEGPRSQWQPYLTLLLQRWIRGTCCSMNIVVITQATLNAEKSIVKKLLQISLDMVPVLQHHMFWGDYVDQTICDLTNFFMAFISQPILPEQAAMIGTASTLLHTNLCIDVEERGFTVTGDMLNQHQDLLVLLFESFIQHVQLASADFIKLISGRVAWCLKSILNILLNANQLETSGLRTRVLKLIVFLLHYYEAIDILATSTTSIAPFVWGPTIEMAKNGLLTAVTLSPTTELTTQQSNIIYKAKRAFVSLEMISTHPRACERLVDCNVLQLVDITLIPTGDIMEKTASLLAVYALFVRFIAALSRRTAFVRTRLRDECALFPMIMKLLQEAIEHKEARKEDAVIKLGWTQVISSCLLVVSSFQYDDASMKMWLSWDQGDVKDDTEMVDEECTTQPLAQNRSRFASILPSLLIILFPWRLQGLDINEVLKSSDHYQVIILAAQVLDQLSGIPLCGRQMIMDETALSNLSALMIALTTAAVCKKEIQVDQSTMVMCKDKIEGQEASIDEFTENIMTENDQEKPTMTEESLNYRCAGYLRKSAIRMLICHDNIQFTILSDAFTTFFESMLQHPATGTSHEYWRREICDDLYEKKFGDFMSLYKFTEIAGDHAIKLYEFTAVAVGYSIIGSPTDEEWNTALGLTVLEGGIVSSKHVFGVFCQMLVYELEEEENKEDPDSLLTLITPFRRNAAAQVIESLALELELVWQVETDSIRNVGFLPDYIPLISPSETVYFCTDDSTQLISGNRQLLRARSPIFEALLSSDYAEESNLAASQAIPLHDVTFHSLNLFISVIHQLNNETSDVLDESIASWPDIVDLLQISDRFGSQLVKNRCQHWVLDRVKHLNNLTKQERLVYLEGLLCLYRQCRDPIESDGGITSDTWPFAVLTRESLKAITQYMTESCQTNEFIKMVGEKSFEELDSFCDGIACLLKK